jgi:hypothetical protein
MSAFLHFYIKHEIIRCFSDGVVSRHATGIFAICQWRCSRRISPMGWKVSVYTFPWSIVNTTSMVTSYFQNDKYAFQLTEWQIRLRRSITGLLWSIVVVLWVKWYFTSGPFYSVQYNILYGYLASCFFSFKFLFNVNKVRCIPWSFEGEKIVIINSTLSILFFINHEWIQGKAKVILMDLCLYLLDPWPALLSRVYWHPVSTHIICIRFILYLHYKINILACCSYAKVGERTKNSPMFFIPLLFSARF